MNAEMLLYVGGLAFLDMLSPTLLGVTVYLMALGQRQFGLRLAVYLLTVTVLYFLLGCILMLAMEFVQDYLSSFFHNKIASWSIFIIGALLFVVSFWIKPSSRKNNRIHSLRSTGTVGVVLMGSTTFLLEAGTALPYFGAVGLMTSKGLSWLEWLPILISYNILMIMPSVLIYLLYTWIGSFIQYHVEKLHRKLVEHSDSMLSWVMCIAGLILIFNVLDYL
nr:GAP family protein [Paenibacillus xylanexedens]